MTFYGKIFRYIKKIVLKIKWRCHKVLTEINKGITVYFQFGVNVIIK